MKTLKSVLIIIVVLGITVTFLKITSDRKSVVSNVENDASTSSEVDQSTSQKEQLCYIWNTEAGDKATLTMNIDDSNVSGEFDWLPAEKDKKTGDFKGTIDSLDNAGNKIANVMWDTHAEGMNTTEELKINFNDTIASPGFGEMKDRGDGVYVYADSTKIDYSLNLQQTDCADSAMN